MPLSKDPDTLRIPAFMRKRSLRAGARRPLLLTALDRKQAGVLPEALQEPLRFAGPKAKKAKVRMVKVHTAKMSSPQKRGSDRFRIKSGMTIQKLPRRIKSSPRAVAAPETFSAPLLDFYSETLVKKTTPRTQLRESPRLASKKLRQKEIGEIIHYYDKIKVAVIKLTGTLCVGDCIRYELAEPSDDEGTYEEVVESMEIDRSPVFKAGRGKEVGITLRKKPQVGSLIF